MLRLLLSGPYFDVPDGGSGGGATEPMGHEDMIEFLSDDDEKETIPLEKDKEIKDDKDSEKGKRQSEKETSTKSDEDEDEESEEEDELAELEDELEPPTDEQLELVTPTGRREILKKYPQLFKDFPYLEKAYYREQQFTEILSTIDDAKAAVEKSQILDKFESDLGQGNTEVILKAMKDDNPRAFAKIVDNYLPTLAKVDTQAYHHVIGNTIRHTIMAMVAEGRRSGNEVLQNAAQILNQFTFGSSDFTAPTNLSNDDGDERENGKEAELKQREQRFIKQQFDASRNDLNTRVNNSLKNTIEANIDPKKSMTDYVRRTASREALESLELIISKDTRFKAIVDRLWEGAFKDNFSKTSVDRIRSAYFSKAKTLLPSVIKKARNEALKGIGKRVVDNDDDDNKATKTGPVKNEQPRSTNRSGKITKPEDIPKNMRTLDFLNSD